MKRIRTLRGTIDGNTVKRLIVDDGRFNNGLKVTAFYVWASSQESTGDPGCVLGIDEDMNNKWDASDNRQIGWAGMTTSPSSRIMDFSLIDPDHIVVSDLFINNFTVDIANYMVVLEAVELSDDQAILALIKERAQDDLD